MRHLNLLWRFLKSRFAFQVGYGHDEHLIDWLQGSKSLRSERIAGGRIGSSFGRVEELAASPIDELVAIVNHEYNLYILDVGSGQIICTIQSKASPGITDIAWSPDGTWVAFTYFISGVSNSTIILTAAYQTLRFAHRV